MSQNEFALHRFVAIRDVADITTIQRLCQLLGSKATLPVVASTATNTIAALVRSNKVPLIDALNGLHNAFLITTNLQILSVIVRGVTDLLLDSAEASLRNADTLSKQELGTVNFTIHASRGQVHPYILIAKLKPECWALLLSELDHVFLHASSYLDSFSVDSLSVDSQQSYSASLLNLFAPFFDTFLLSPSHWDTFQSSTLLHRLLDLVNLPAPEYLDPLRAATLSYLLTVSQRHPLPRANIPGPRYAFLSSLTSACANPDLHSFLPRDDLRRVATTLEYQLLASACEAAHLGLSTFPYIRLLASLSSVVDAADDDLALIAAPQFEILWPALSYLLLDAQTAQDQEAVVRMMRVALEGVEAASVVVVNVALVPLFQVVSEAEEGKGKSGLRERAVEIIMRMERMGSGVSGDGKGERGLAKKITSKIESFGIAGTLAYLCSATCDLLTRYVQDNPNFPTTTSSSAPRTTLPLLFTTPFLLHPSPTTRLSSSTHFLHLATVSASASSSPTNHRFPTLLLLLHLLRHNPPETQTHLLLVCLPQLVHPADPVITARVLRVATAFVEGMHETSATRFKPGGLAPYRDTHLAALGVRVVFEVYRRQPRVWRQLRHIIGEWVKRRKMATVTGKGRSAGAKGIANIETAEFGVEVAVLATIRDLCVLKPHETAEELLPFLATLLQTVSGLHVASLCLIVEALTACVRAQVVEPRASWNVLMRKVSDYAVNIENAAVLCRVCEFYGLVAEKGEETETYFEFKQIILTSHIHPLLSHPSVPVRTAALTALARFPASDIMTVLVDSPKRLIASLLNHSGPQHAGVLSRLLQHEVECMRRGLFKAAAEREKDKANVALEGDEVRQGGQALADVTLSAWDGGTVNPGLRSGYAMAVLFAFGSAKDRKAEGEGQGLKSGRFRRYLQTALADVAAPDHLLVRVAAVGGWAALFEAVVRGVWEEDGGEQLVEEMVVELRKELEGATVPSVCANVVLALAGFVSTIHCIDVSTAATHATRLIRKLLDEYILPAPGSAPKNVVTSSLASSEEVRSAVAIALGRLTACVLMDERVVREVVEALMAGVVNDRGENRNDPSNWPNFAHGYALGQLVSVLAASPSKTSGTASLATATTLSLVGQVGSPTTSFNSALGALMGLASSMVVVGVDPESVMTTRAVYDTSLELLRRFVSAEGNIDESETSKGAVLGAVWVVSAYVESRWENDDVGAKEQAPEREEAWGLLEKAIQIVAPMRDWIPYYFHFLVPYAQLLHSRLARQATAANLTAYNAQIQAQLHLASAPASSSVTRLCATLTLGTLAGVRYLDGGSPAGEIAAWSYLLGSDATRETRERVWDALARMAGIANAPKDLKGGRVASVVLGRVVEVERKVRREKEGRGAGTGGASAFMMGSSSTEPRDYSRLAVPTSYLRAVFDGCWELVQRPASADNSVVASIFLESLTMLPTPLPSVNWFSLLTRLSSISLAAHLRAVVFASKHAVASVSLMEFLVAQLLAFAADSTFGDREVRLLLVNEMGIGKVLELAGIERWRVEVNEMESKEERRRGMDAVMKKVNVPASRCVEVVGGLVGMLKSGSGVDEQDDRKELLQFFIATLSNHLPSSAELPTTTTADAENVSTLVAELRVLIHQEIVVPLLSPAHSMSANISGKDAQILRCAIECSVFDIKDSLLDDGLMTTRNALAACELVRLARAEATEWVTRVVRGRMLDILTETSVGEEELVVDCIMRAMDADVARQAEIGPISGRRQKEERTRLEWVVRILDMFILAAGVGAGAGADRAVKRGIEGMLRRVVERWWWSGENGGDEVEPEREVVDQFAELTFTFGEVVYSAGAVGAGLEGLQEQIVKRLLILADTIATTSLVQRCLIDVLRRVMVNSGNLLVSEEMWKLI
ncbi:hypothetical protein BC938DRAFT_478274 [Jimgerdemannia flammicorona]|uniref:DUF3730 domain-containing protein n=1 Tax=Jimgerdemannia flammicorona TaxID=994334 RepID=A0A433QN39_9FUNG|nr:hypothetical protein BC938DRAFT_478274 [Jimgerdemannia flammicorona]